jgi:UDP:flavonoid glycosyltransferase YjiC (YdhE family)
MQPLRIEFLSPPFAGHLHPILGMAQALAQSHEVRVVTTPGAAASVRAAGIEPVSILAQAETRLLDIVNTPSPVRSHPLRLYRQLIQTLDLHEQLRAELELRYARVRPDLLIADFTLAAVGGVARDLDIPWWTSLPSPCVLEGGDGPPSYLGGLKPTRGALGRARDALGHAATRAFKLAVGKALGARLRRCGLHSIYRADGSESVYSNERILLIGWPDLEFRKTWPAYACFIPPILHTPPVADCAPAFVPRKRHVLVTQGTHLKFAKQAAARAARSLAASAPDLEVHFSDGELGGNTVERAGNFQRLPFIDYERHLGRYDLVIHHGGSGVMYHCLAHGIPSIVHPIDYDQFDYAARLEAAGLAHWLRRLEELDAACPAVLRDQALKARCVAFARSHDPRGHAELLRGHLEAWSRRV